MFAGHYGSAFVAKAAAPRVPLWTLLLAAQLVDILWVLFVLSGVEHARLLPALPSNPLDLYDMPYTHSLLATVVWSTLGFVGARHVLSLDARAAFVVGATVASHWFLDLPVHRQDLPLYGQHKVGLGLWNFPLPAYALEVVCIVLSLWLCVRSRGPAARRLWPWLAFGGALVLLQTVTSFGPLPTSLVGMLVPVLALYLIVPWVGARVEGAADRIAPSPGG